MSKKLITALLLITSMLLNMFVAVNTYAYTASGDEILIYVAPDGNDKNQGTIDAPLKTFAGAKHRVRQAAGSKTIRVIFREGQYNITESQYFDMRDSGRKNAPVIYEAYEGEKVVLSGATRLNPNDFKKVEDKEILMRIPVDARDNVLQMDLKKYGINKLITMTEMVVSAVSAGYDSSRMIGYLFLDNKEQMISQWPNGDGAYDYMGKVYLKGSTTSFKVNMEGAACVGYTKDRCDLWKNAIGDAYFQIYPHNDYRAEILALVDLDTIEKKMYISGGSQGFDGMAGTDARLCETLIGSANKEQPHASRCRRAVQHRHGIAAFMAKNQPLEQEIIRPAARMSAAVEQHLHLLEGLFVNKRFVGILNYDPVFARLLQAFFRLVTALYRSPLHHTA